MSTFDDEKRMQPFMDAFYRVRGWTIDRTNACRHFDCEIAQNGSSLKVEEKYLFSDPYSQGLIEIIQDLRTADLGWFYHTKCDLLFWVHCPSDRVSPPKTVFIINWPKTKALILDQMEAQKWQDYNHCPQHYGLTLNYPLKWDGLISQGLVKRFELTWDHNELYIEAHER